MDELRLQVLGGLAVVRDGEHLSLPPSKKTRALLAYLALNARQLRRESLCELLWEIPDDPRGSLRWSLSKIRKLVDDEQTARVIADRSHIALDTSNATIDLHELQALVNDGLDRQSDEFLIESADRYSGVFLDGLELADFHDYYTWCIGERQRASGAQALLLSSLCHRLQSQPEQALNYANRLVTLTPFEVTARAGLITLLRRLGRLQEAEQQYKLGLQKLKESGTSTESSDEGQHLLNALRSELPRQSIATATPAPATLGAVTDTVDKTLVGRQRELEWLASKFSALKASGRARVLLIRGDPGMGKSRLLQAAAVIARSNDASILKATCFESERTRPFAAWNDAMRRARPDNPASALLASSDQVSRDQVFSCLSDLVAEETRQRPLMVLFDDCHWGDESSASALLYVMRINRHQPIMVVAAGREVELRDNAAVQQCIRGLKQDQLLEELQLAPLPDDDLRQLINAQIPGADAERLSRESNGNPLLAIELARAEAQGSSSSSLSDLVQERMERLSEKTVNVLKWAAVLAPRINIKPLEQVTGLHRDEVDSAIEAAEEQGILHPGERGFRFSHELVASSVYQLVSPSRRRSMHRRVAELLKTEAAQDLPLAASLAHHAKKSGDPSLAADALVSAGRLCLRFYAYPDALELFHQGLEFALELDDAERIKRTLELNELKLTAQPPEDWRTAAQDYITLAEQALDHGLQAHARLGYQMAAYTRWVHGDWRDAQRDSLQAERVTRNADGEAQVLGMAEAAKCLALLERDLQQADAMAMEASALALRQNIQCGAVHLSTGILRYYEGRLDEAVEQLETGRAIYKAEGDRLNEFLANEYLALIEIDRDDFSAAARHCRALLDMGSRLPEGSEGPFSEAITALCEEGEQEQQTCFEQALAALRTADAKQRLIFLLNRAALLDLRNLRLQRAQHRATEALQLSELMDRPSETLMALLTLAEIKGENSPPNEAEQLQKIEQQLRSPVASWARQRASQLLRQGG
jgi:DNA-binding SARP family transcriptional activator/predicted ATPase